MLNIHGDTITHTEHGTLVIADTTNKQAWVKCETPVGVEQ